MKKNSFNGSIYFIKKPKKLLLTMKLTVLLSLICLLPSIASVYSQEEKISLDIDNKAIKEVLREIEMVSEYRFFFSDDLLPLDERVNLKVKNEKVHRVLDNLLTNKALSYQLANNNLVLIVPDNFLQEITIKGKVIDTEGNLLPGVNVVEKGTTNGAITNLEGEYTISVSSPDAILSFSFVGFLTEEIEVGGKTAIDVILVEDIQTLEEVVVTALGITSKKKSLGYSVDKITGEDIGESEETNVVNSLAGRVAGVKITPSSSGMGGSSRLIIRGNSSLTGNNQPLYVVDGIPIDNTGFGGVTSNNAAPNVGRPDYGSGISDINPGDIQSISVLKGPNAAALYGNRAANGVIIITTKKGSFRKGLGISYSGSYMASTINEETLPQFQNEYGQGSNGVFVPDGQESWGAKLDGSTFTYPTGFPGVYSPQPNNVKDFFKTGLESINTITIDNASENTSIRASYTNFTGKGTVQNSTLNKNTFNLRVETKLSSKLSFDSKITYFTQNADNRAVQGWDLSRNPTNVLYRIVRNAILDDYKNNYKDEAGISISPYVVNKPTYNPYYIQNDLTNKDERRRVLGFAKMTYTFNENLSSFLRIGTDALSEKITAIKPWGADARVPEGQREDSRTGLTETNADFLVMFNKDLGSGFNLNLNAGGNYRYNKSDVSSRSGDNFNIPTSYLYANLQDLYAGSESSWRSSVYSLYFSGSFDYKEMIYLNFTGRNDWDSGLWTQSGTSKDWSYFYPSLSLSVLGNDLLGIDSKILSFSKIRLAWSEVGSGGSKNDRVYYYLGSSTGYNGLISVTQSNVYDDPDLGPERTRSNELGLELKFFNNRLYTDFTLYKSITYDQIVNAPVDASTGFEYVRTNIGEISNKGFELMVGGTPVQSDNFAWDASVNLSKNTNTLESFIEGTDSYYFGGSNNYSVLTKVGGHIGDIWGNNFVYHDGKMVVDANGIPVVSDEPELLGNFYPDLACGLLNTFRYKNINLKILIDGQIGGEAFNWTSSELAAYGSLEQTLEGRDGMILDAVANTGTSDNPVYEKNTAEISSHDYWAKLQGIPAAHVEDLTNIRLREVTLSYNLPSSLLDEIFINKASISLVGRNLFFLVNKSVGVDPEASVTTGNGQGIFYYNMPSMRRFGFSLNVSF